MTNAWDRPPPSDPWGRAHPGPPQQDSLGRPTFAPVTQPWDGVPQEFRLPPPMTPPSLVPTVVVTALAGLFGVIPASVHAARARSIGLPGGGYWKAFGITLAVMSAFWTGAVALSLSMLPSLFGTVPVTSTATGPSYPPTTPALPAGTIPAQTQHSPTPPAPTPTQHSPTPPAPTPTNRAVTSLPAGSWITVLDSLAKNERSEAEAWVMANGLSWASAPVLVVDTDAVRGLTPGYWAVAVVGSSTRAEAADLCAGFGRGVGGTCYPRQVA